MIKTVLIIFLFLLAIFGLGELIHTIRLAFKSPGRPYKIYSIAFLESGRAIDQINFMVEQSNWLGDSYAEKLIAVYTQLDSAEQDICETVARQNNMIICPIEVLENVVSSISFQ